MGYNNPHWGVAADTTFRRNTAAAAGFTAGNTFRADAQFELIMYLPFTTHIPEQGLLRRSSSPLNQTTSRTAEPALTACCPQIQAEGYGSKMRSWSWGHFTGKQEWAHKFLSFRICRESAG
jgi:hypothetical protein